MPDLKTIDYYADLAADLVDNPENVDARNMWESIDKMARCEVNIPPNITAKAWIGTGAKFGHSLPGDIIAGTKTFLASRLPIIHFVPMMYTNAVHEKMEYLETAFDWHYALMNRRGDVPVQVQIVEDAVRYMACAFQTEYMPYEAKRTKGDEPLYTPSEIKEMKRLGAFRWIRHHPGSVYPVRGNTLKSVLQVAVLSYAQLIAEYGETDEIKRAIAKEFQGKPTASDLRNRYTSRFDQTVGVNRAVWFTSNGTEKTLQTDGETKYTILRAKRDLPFMPWAVQDFGSPLMAGIVKSGVYDHLAVMDIIQFCDWLDKADQPTDDIATSNPENPRIRIDGEGPSAQYIHDNQTTIKRLSKSPIDQQWMVLRSALENQLRSSAKAEAVVNLANAVNGSSQVGTINMYQATAIAQLNDVINLSQRAIAEGLYQECQFIYETKEPLLGFRREEKDSSERGRVGAQFFIDTSEKYRENAPGDTVYIDPQMINIEVELQPTTVQDRQALVNQAILEKQIGVPKSIYLEKLVKNPKIATELAYQDIFEENFVKMQLMKDESETQAQAIIAVAKQTAQMIVSQAQVQQTQQQGQPGGLPPTQETQTQQMNAGAQFAGAQGIDGRTGGNSARQVVPNETRNTVNGTTDSGQALT
jgi:hypothetical protein